MPIEFPIAGAKQKEHKPNENDGSGEESEKISQQDK